jgi:hypothetical protein
MTDEHPDGDAASQRWSEELSDRVAANRADIDALGSRLADADHHAEAGDGRADASEARADTHEAQAGDDRGRIDTLEAPADVDRQMIAKMRADGVSNRATTVRVERGGRPLVAARAEEET